MEFGLVDRVGGSTGELCGVETRDNYRPHAHSATAGLWKPCVRTAVRPFIPRAACPLVMDCCSLHTRGALGMGVLTPQ